MYVAMPGWVRSMAKESCNSARIGGIDQWREKRRCPIQQKTSQPMRQPGKAMVGSISGLLVLVCPGQRGSGQWLSLQMSSTGPSRLGGVLCNLNGREAHPFAGSPHVV